MSNQELVPVMVPKQLLSAVYKLLASGMEGPTEPNVPSGATLPNGEVNWTEPANSKRLRYSLHLVSRTMFELTSAQPGKPVFFGQLMEKTGCTNVQARAHLSSLTKVIKRDFKVPTGKWPVEAQWDYEKKEMSYTMDEETAKAWKASAPA